MLKYTIQDDDSQVVTPKPGSTDPLQGKVSMHVTFTDYNNDESAVQYFEVESLDPVVIDSALKSAAIAYNDKVLVQEAQSAFDNPFDTLTIGEPVEFDDDGTPGTASITGVVWVDNDQDGIRDDVGRLNGVSIQLRMAVDNSVVDTVTTDANGIYTFTAVENGAYYLHFATPAGYAITLQNQGADDTLDSDINPGTGNTANFNVANDEEITGYDAGMYQLSTLTGTLWNDTDEDGIHDGGETTGFNAVTVELHLASDDSLVDTTTTDANGVYEFTDIEPEEYYVEIPTVPTGYAVSLQDQGADDTVDSDFDVATKKTANITIGTAETVENVDCGFYLLTGTISGIVWTDTDHDGIRDGGETAGVLGATVELHLSSDDSLVDSVETAAPGTYEFTDIVPDDYYVKFTPITDYAISPQDQGADDTVDSDANASTGETATITVGGGDTITNVDCGMYLSTNHITGSLFDDWDRDSTWDVGDESLFTVGTLVEVCYSVNDVVANSATITDGTYDLTVVPGDYYVKVTPPTDYELSPLAGDSEFNATTHKSENFTVNGGDTVVYDCGLMHELGYVDAHVFVDDGAGGGTGNNGVQDGTELDWLTGGGVFLRVTHPLGGFNDAYPEIADGTIHLQVRSGTGLTATWMFVDAYATGYHITGGTNPETINVTANSTTDLGDRGVAAD